MAIEAMQFPILMFGQDGSVSSVRSAQELFTGWAGAIRRGYYRDLLIVDSAGKGYVIQDAVIQVKTHVFHRILEVFVSRRVPITLLLKEERPVALQEMKKLAAKARRSLFAGTAPDEAAEVKRAIKEATDPSEIVQAIVRWDWGASG